MKLLPWIGLFLVLVLMIPILYAGGLMIMDLWCYMLLGRFCR